MSSIAHIMKWICLSILLGLGACGTTGSVNECLKDTDCKDIQSCEGGRCLCPDNKRLCQKRCIDLQTQSQHCGKCNRSCKNGEWCALGQCIPKCTSPTPDQCKAGCVDLKTDANHCGKCNKNCRVGERCVKGKCNPCPVSSPKCGEHCCPKSFQCCKNKKGRKTCTPIQLDSQNCGKCGNICPKAQSCCSGQCTSLVQDSAHCGKCGNKCPSGERCCGGKCTKVGANPRHCGACEQLCPSGMCCGGKCLFPNSGYHPNYKGSETKSTELCDGKDNDCNGKIDEVPGCK